MRRRTGPLCLCYVFYGWSVARGGTSLESVEGKRTADEPMSMEEKDIESFLEVGALLMFHTDPNRKDGPRYKTILRGWRKGAHVLLDRPKTDTGLFVAVQEAQQCVIRFIKEGQACAFDAIVIDWDARRNYPYLRITWPQSLQYVLFRKHERLKIELPCMVFFPDGTSSTGEIRDISAGGCGVVCTGSTPLELEQLKLAFELSDGVRVEDVQTTVRSVRKTNDGAMYGCEFMPNQPRVQNDITFFVTSRLEWRRSGEKTTGVHVVLVGGDVDFVGRLRRGFERKNVEVVAAPGVVDALCQIRGTSTQALLVAEDLRDLPVANLCRLVRLTHGLERLPLFVFGGNGNARDSLLESGATGYFPASPSLAPDMVFEIGKALAAQAT